MSTLHDILYHKSTRPGAVKSVYDVVPIGVKDRPQYPDTAPQSLINAYKRSELVYACIKVKTNAVKDPRLIVERKQRDGTWQEVEGHPLRRLLMRPNPDMDEAKLLGAMIASQDIAGVFYAEKQRSTAKAVVGLWPLNPKDVFPVPRSDGTVEYEWRVGSPPYKTIPAEDMLVIRDWNIDSKYKPLAPLAVALGATDADAAQTDYIRAFFNNAGVPSGILTTEQELNQEQSDLLRDRWRAKFARFLGRQHDIAVLGKGATYSRAGANLDELDSESVRGVTETRVCMVFGVPPLIVYAYIGLTRATYSNLKEAWASFWDATLSPTLKDIRSALLWGLLSEFESEDAIYGEQVRLSWDLSRVAALQEDVDAAQNRSRANFQAGGMTLNEFRSAIGTPADPAGDYYVRGMAVQAVQVGTSAEPASVDATQTRSGYRPSQLKALKAASTQTIERRIEQRMQTVLAKHYDRIADAVLEET
jgi:HK97 family phage portal protein